MSLESQGATSSQVITQLQEIGYNQVGQKGAASKIFGAQLQ